MSWCVAPAQMWQRGIALSSCPWPGPNLATRNCSPLRCVARPQIGNENLFLAVVLGRDPSPNVATSNCSQLRRPAPPKTWQRQIGLRSVAWPRLTNWKRQLVSCCVSWCVAPAQLWQRGIALSSCPWPRPKLGNEKLFPLRCVARPKMGNGNLSLAVVPGARPQPKCGNE